MKIAEYIEKDIEATLRNGDSLPCKLTIGALASNYRVSPTPVRHALQNLVDMGLIKRMENGRLSVVPIRRSKKKRIQVPAKPVDWESVLAQEILMVSLRGETSFLREEAMAERHGIGRTLLRRVFNRLSGGGLLLHVPRRGWKVESFQEEDLDAFVDIRAVLESRALQLSRDHVHELDLRRMLEGNSDAAVKNKAIDNELHRYFVSCSGNRYIKSFFESNGSYYMALFDYATLGVEVVSEMAIQHRAILEDVLKKRWSRAEKALTHHIHAQKPIMQKMIEKIIESNAHLS